MTARAQDFVRCAGATVLVTGFGPFPGAPFNPTGPLVRRLARSPRPALAGVSVAAHVFPTRYDAVAADLPRLLATHRPVAVVMFGLAARTPHLRIERRARNRRSVLLPDVGGVVATAPRIRPGGPAFLHSRAPLHALVALARSAGLRARVSPDAGRYLCNDAYWRALDGGSCSPLAVFVHVPRIPRSPRPPRATARAMTLEDLVRTAERMVVAMGAAGRRERLPRPAPGHGIRPAS